MDTFKSVHKIMQHTKIMIYPVFLGSTVDGPEQDFENFKVRSPNSKNLHSKLTQGSADIAVYYDPEEPLAGSLKSCIITVNENQQGKDIDEKATSGEVDIAKET